MNWASKAKLGFGGYAIGKSLLLGSAALVKGKEKGRRKFVGQFARYKFWARSLTLAGAHGSKVTVLLDVHSLCPTNRLWCSRAPQAWLAVASRVEPQTGAELQQGPVEHSPRCSHSCRPEIWQWAFRKGASES